MVTRIDKLTDRQIAAMDAYADEQIRRATDCTPVDRASVEDGMRRCYEAAGLRWHGNVVWVGSPIVAAFAGPIAGSILGVAVDGAVGVAVGVAVDGAVGVAVDDAVGGAVGVAVGVAVGDAVGGAVDGAVDGAVGDAVNGAVRDAVGGSWYRYLGGQWWTGWIAWRSFFRDECGLELADGLWDRHAAYEDANQAGWWWPHRDFVIVSERPTSMHLERIGPRGWGSHQMHCETGPAIEWDGWELHFWHGTRVPSWVVGADGGPTLERINAEANTEVRRCAIEAYGWDRYLTDLGVTPVDVADDPGNAGHSLQLFDLPESAQLYAEPVRLLVMENASVDRGTRSRRTYAETVPVSCRSAIEAAAWQFDVDPETYRELARAT